MAEDTAGGTATLPGAPATEHEEPETKPEPSNGDKAKPRKPTKYVVLVEDRDPEYEGYDGQRFERVGGGEGIFEAHYKPDALSDAFEWLLAHELDEQTREQIKEDPPWLRAIPVGSFGAMRPVPQPPAKPKYDWQEE